MSTDAELFDAAFFTLGMQYYAAARSAARAGLLPVCGNLFHHALEMFLKGRLINIHSSKELRNRPFGHSLPGLWTAFKADTKADLDEFDDTVGSVNEFEALRYPDDLLKKGAEMRLEWAPFMPPTEFAYVGTITVPKFKTVVSDIDRLVATIFEVCSRNPRFFTGAMNAYARDAIIYENQACHEWFTVETVTSRSSDPSQ